jgi:hypothetical protein
LRLSNETASLFAIGLLSLSLTACAVKPAKGPALRIEAPVLVPCERIDADESGLRLNGDVWELKDQAIKLLDTCADQVDAQIVRSQSK